MQLFFLPRIHVTAAAAVLVGRYIMHTEEYHDIIIILKVDVNFR